MKTKITSIGQVHAILVARGFELTKTKQTHWKVTKGGNLYGIIMDAKDTDWRAARNFVTLFRRRYGVDLEREEG